MRTSSHSTLRAAPMTKKKLAPSVSKKATSKKPLKRTAPARAKAKTASPRPAAATAAPGKYVFTFADGRAEGHETMRNLLGGKGANLHGMTTLGLPVPPGFTISTEICTYYYANKNSYPKTVDAQVRKSMTAVEKSIGKKFGDAKNPLLVSVRSGARASMPGMMDTILNLGLNDTTVEGLIAQSKDPRFSYDSYRRFVMMYADVVLGLHSNLFEAELENAKHARGVELDTELTADDLKSLVAKFKTIVRTEGKVFPEDPWEQLWGAVGAVFGSWMTPRAITYRRLNDIPESWGTAVNVQAMVFGNMGDDCATGVAFTRDPSTGAKKFFGEFLINAQGEDVVSGIRTPQPINEASRQAGKDNAELVTLQAAMPKAYAELVKLYQKLERHYRDMQDIEFTIERNRLYMLQTRNGKRTAAAALKIAVDMVAEKLITKQEAILRIKPDQLDQLLHPRLDPAAAKKVIAKGLPASPGAACGQVVFDPDRAEVWAKEGKAVILVRIETSPEDIHGMAIAQGILTARGGMTSHAAVVARGMGKCCVAGCSAMKVSYERKEFAIGNTVIREGEFITLDGTSGEVIVGRVATIRPTLNQDFQELMKWMDQIRSLRVRTNADTPADAKVARDFGAEGIGLCRTEHMFFEPARIQAVREMILSESREARVRALQKILPMQRGDFKGIFKEMQGLPVTIRLLDPPLHEFLPSAPHGKSLADSPELKTIAAELGVSMEAAIRKVESLHEFNPMLGHRGCRLAVSYPEIYVTQVTAIFEAAIELYAEIKNISDIEVMIPLVGDIKELDFVVAACRAEIERVLAAAKAKTGKAIPVRYKIGTMIEVPRAALTAGEIAKTAEFFSFGTNDLTQMTYGLSRDDSGTFLKDYIDNKIFERDPFAELDRSGVGRLMEIAFTEGRRTRPDLKVGICGEHGGEPRSVEFCHALGLDYVSCSPYRVPIAKLAAAHAAIQNPRPVLKTRAVKR